MRYLLIPVLLSMCFVSVSQLRGDNRDVQAILTRAATADSAASEAAIAELRAGGPRMLAGLFEIRDKPLASSNDSSGKTTTERLDAIIDRVGGQRYCTASRLFWHTDLAAAQAAAHESGKPILSLRMMGNLTDEFSCANSRFFRTSLYANREISDYLRNNFVLHWKSVRPVPKVTIDFGDGRKLERTLTGNSIHYILAADGQPIDALPGLYGPAAFTQLLREAETAAKLYARVDPAQQRQWLVQYHAQRLRIVAQAWEADVAKLSASSPMPSGTPANVKAALEAAAARPDAQGAAAFPRADAAAEIARPKALLEMPLIRAVASIETLEKKTDEGLWERIAQLHAGHARLDAASIALIRKQNPTALTAAAVAITKSRVEDPILRLVARFQSSIALDTVRNEYLLHSKIHQWFAGGTAESDVEKLNERVYAELFLTPKADPWIGLAPPDTYTALENGGLVPSTAK